MNVSEKLTAYNIRVVQNVFWYICKTYTTSSTRRLQISRDKLSKIFLLLSTLQFTALTAKISKLFNNNPHGSRLRGRPKRRWWICVQTDINVSNIKKWKERGQKTNLTMRCPLWREGPHWTLVPWKKKKKKKRRRSKKKKDVVFKNEFNKPTFNIYTYTIYDYIINNNAWIILYWTSW